MPKFQLSARSAIRNDAVSALAVVVFALIGLPSSPVWSQPKDIKWGTSSVGSSGHKALVALAEIISKTLPEYRITVMPTAGAVATVKGFATGEFDGFYGSDVAFKELKEDAGRFKGFKANINREPVQSFWCFTIAVGLAINAKDRDAIKSWGDLAGKTVYTGPLPFDARRHLENAMAALGVKHVYQQVDFETVGSQLSSGAIKAMTIWAAGGETPPPWLAEASLAVDWAALNPSPDELAGLKAKGFAIDEVEPANFRKKEIYVNKVKLLPFYYGFDLGLDIPTDDMLKMLITIEQHADELAKLDPSFKQIGAGKMAAFQRLALESSWNLAPIHPGLAKYMQAKGVWDSKWDANIAKN